MISKRLLLLLSLLLVICCDDAAAGDVDVADADAADAVDVTAVTVVVAAAGVDSVAVDCGADAMSICDGVVDAVAVVADLARAALAAENGLRAPFTALARAFGSDFRSLPWAGDFRKRARVSCRRKRGGGGVGPSPADAVVRFLRSWRF